MVDDDTGQAVQVVLRLRLEGDHSATGRLGQQQKQLLYTEYIDNTHDVWSMIQSTVVAYHWRGAVRVEVQSEGELDMGADLVTISTTPSEPLEVKS